MFFFCQPWQLYPEKQVHQRLPRSSVQPVPQGRPHDADLQKLVPLRFVRL